MGSGDSQELPRRDCRKRSWVPRSIKSKRISRFGHRCRRPIERKMRMLEKLVPKSSCSDDESMGIQRVFRETADYIMALRMRVELMQIMVDAFSPAASHHH